MITTIEAVFEKCVFRPLQQVAIPENRRVKISLDDWELTTDKLKVQPLPVGEYPNEELGDDFDYRTVPIHEVSKKQVRFVCTGEIPPLPKPTKRNT